MSRCRENCRERPALQKTLIRILDPPSYYLKIKDDTVPEYKNWLQKVPVPGMYIYFLQYIIKFNCNKNNKISWSIFSFWTNYYLICWCLSLMLSTVVCEVSRRARRGGGVAGQLRPPNSVKMPSGSSSSWVHSRSSASGGVRHRSRSAILKII